MKKENKSENIVISPPNFETVALKITGTAPYMQARFAKKAELMMKHQQGSTGKKGTTKKARDFEADCREALHLSTDGWPGIPASSIRAACVSACRIVGFKMTLAKLSIFVESDGRSGDGMPLIMIDGDWEMNIMHTRNATGVCDLRARPMWRAWSAVVRIWYDADQFKTADIVNLLSRVGLQVGLGEGRPDSKSSTGLGFGTFDVTGA